MKENDYLVNDTVLLHTLSMFRLYIYIYDISMNIVTK